MSDLQADWEAYRTAYCKEGITLIQASVLLINAPDQGQETVKLLVEIGWPWFWANEALKIHRVAKCEVMEKIVGYIFH